MQSAKEKVSNMASAAKEKIDIAKAKSQEKAEKVRARTEEEKRMADEREKAKEAEAKADLHAAKARHAGEKMDAKQTHNVPGTAGIRTGTGHHHIPGTGHHHDEYGSTYTTANKPVIGGTPAATMPGTTGATTTRPRGHKYL